MRAMVINGVLAALALRAAGAPCSYLAPGGRVQGAVPVTGSACYLLDQVASAPVQVTISQTTDVRLSATAEDSRFTIVSDGFDFGDETLTIVEGVRWHIHVAANGRITSPAAFRISAQTIDAGSAALWREAENTATNARKSTRVADIARALARWQSLGAGSNIARTWLRLGSVRLRSGDASASLAAAGEAYRLCTLTADLRCRAEAANNSGLAARRLGDTELARARFSEAAEGWQALKHEEGTAITLSNLGLLLSQTGEWQQAIASFDRAGRLLRARDPVAHARVLNNLGLCYLSLGEHQKAQACFRSALAAFPAGSSEAVRARINRGRTYMLSGRTGLARSQLERAVYEGRQVDDRAALADALNNLGQLMLEMSQQDEACRYLNEASAIYLDLHDRRGQASTLHHLGVSAWRRDQKLEARAALRQALQIRTDINLRDDAAASATVLAELELDAKNLEGARRYAEQALTIIESVRTQVPGASLRASYYGGVRKVFDVLIDIVMQTSTPEAVEEGFLIAERGRAQALLDVVTRNAQVAVPEVLQVRRDEIRRKLNSLSLRLATATEGEAELRRAIQLVLAEDQQVEALVSDARQASAVRRRPSFLQIAAAMPRDSAIFEYYLGPRRSFLWVVDRGRLSVFRLPAADQIRSEAAALSRLFGRILDRRRFPREQRAFALALRQLSQTVLGPVSHLSLPDHILMVPDGVLHSVPMAALTVPGARTPLGLAHDIVRVPASTYLISGRLPRPVEDFPLTLLAVTDPVFSPGDPRVRRDTEKAMQQTSPALPRLPFTANVKSLLSLVPPARRRMLQGFDAAPAELRRLRLSDYAVLHFATHAIVDHEIPEMSRIALSLVDPSGRPKDGYLRPYEIAGWKLDGPLVVLAACNTAQGKQVTGEGVLGLSNSLLQAGASQLIAAVAPIDDEASARFFDHVYRHMLGPRPVSAARALTMARRAIARNPRWSDPYYWAALEMTGQPER